MVSAIMLAAGESRRMADKNKLLLPFSGRTLIEHIIERITRSEAKEVIVVLGHEADRVKDVLKDYNVQFVQNNHFRQGMTTSIHAGVKAVSVDTDGMMICLSDLPLIETKELNHLIEVFENTIRKNNKQIVVPVFNGQRGNPVVFSVKYKSGILEHKGLMGCKGIVKQNPDQVLELEMNTNHILQDIDTIEDYENITRS